MIVSRANQTHIYKKNSSLFKTCTLNSTTNNTSIIRTNRVLIRVLSKMGWIYLKIYLVEGYIH